MFVTVVEKIPGTNLVKSLSQKKRGKQKKAKKKGEFFQTGHKSIYRATIKCSLLPSASCAWAKSRNLYCGLFIEHYKIYIVFFVICRATQSKGEETVEWSREKSSTQTPGKLHDGAQSSRERGLHANHKSRKNPGSKILEGCEELCVQHNRHSKPKICYTKT